jgi:hypothetical protein
MGCCWKKDMAPGLGMKANPFDIFSVFESDWNQIDGSSLHLCTHNSQVILPCEETFP